jgi:hypothetical protein
MTATTQTTSALLRHAAMRATLAPSVHNTQPWRFVLAGDALEIHADPTRQLKVLDPTKRQMLISCGARCSTRGSHLLPWATTRSWSASRMRTTRTW